MQPARCTATAVPRFRQSLPQLPELLKTGRRGGNLSRKWSWNLSLLPARFPAHEVRGEAANVGAGVAQDARIPPATVHGPGMVAGNGHGGSQARRHRSSRPARRGDTETHMAKYLVSFPAAAM